ncbi:cytochrome b [Alcanivorax sp.]|jgi:cytochrome b561|uniref:cytochrome b n=1 Tax=Alcanivorax sp. TaxID=1872427 RepID=UPI0025BFE0AD|nr:cytochrome b [Alcanivorax sp.]
MKLRNDPQRFGAIALLFHWLVALAVIGLFALGFYMVDLGYYDPWYRKGPDLHRSIGILLFIAMLLRLAWRFISPPPAPLPTHKPWEKISAHLTHWALYLLLFVAMISGYLISSADGSSVDVFNWFAVPSVSGHQTGLEDTAGLIHYWATWAVIGLAGLHALAAVKHHLFDRDDTLRRILGLAPRPTTHTPNNTHNLS